MRIKVLSALAVVGALSACGGGFEVGPGGAIQIPITTITQTPAGEYTLRGYIQPLLNFGSTFAMTRVETGAECTGETNARGQGRMECDDGLVVMINIPSDQYGKPTGNYVDGNTAVGWGNDSDPAFVASLQ